MSNSESNQTTSEGSHFNSSQRDFSSSPTENLKGKELLDYIDFNKRESNIDGDLLCMGAGYVTYAEDGTYSCDFQKFSSEVIKAKHKQHYASEHGQAMQIILDTYHQKTG